MITLVITRVVHSSVLVAFGESAILTDPWYSERPGYYHGEPVGIAIKALPRLTGVVVSHNHYDHYDMQAFAAYPDKTVPIVVKRGTAEPALQAGFQHITELDPWETLALGPVKVTATPGKHSVPENTYILEAEGFTVFFGGDTLLISELREVARRFPHIDVALVAINGLMIRPLLNRQVVMNAQDAAELCKMLQPRVAIPIHYKFTAGRLRDMLLLKYKGTPEEFSRAVAQRAPESLVRILAPGEPLQIKANSV
jgi:L-ascorbate metabolism protein UlaG (beta-lactamase superfamily)